MKLNKLSLALALIAAAFLPTYSCAELDTISISASFERGLHCNLSTITSTVVIAGTNSDPMEKEINALVNSTTDPVLASYYRDLYRGSPSPQTVQFARVPDPYVDAITLALYGWVQPDSRRVC